MLLKIFILILNYFNVLILKNNFNIFLNNKHLKKNNFYRISRCKNEAPVFLIIALK
jgi:uncharacterized membrane protein